MQAAEGPVGGDCRCDRSPRSDSSSKVPDHRVITAQDREGQHRQCPHSCPGILPPRPRLETPEVLRVSQRVRSENEVWARGIDVYAGADAELVEYRTSAARAGPKSCL